MWATVAKLVGGPLIKRGFKWLMGKQEERKQARALKAEWEVVQAKRSTWFMRLFAAIHIIGPIDYAFYLSVKSAWPLKSPSEVAEVISTTLNAFPTWWSGAAITILLAAWGIREHGQVMVERSRAKAGEYRAEAAKELQKRKDSIPNNLP